MKRAKTNGLFLLLGLSVVAFLSYLGFESKPAAAIANNQTINFQGRLLNSQGAVAPDGFYNIQFKVYQDGDGQSAGDTTGSPSGSLKWTENWLNSGSHGVKVVNGFLTVPLGSVTAFGSNIDWNQGTLWLSMNVGDTSNCTITTNFTSNCAGDGEMLPMQPLTASPYSLNSGELGGLTSNNFVQLAQGLQGDSSTANASIAINKTGTTANILQLQRGGVDVLTVGNTGNVSFRPYTSSDSTTFLQVQNAAGTNVFNVDTTNGIVGTAATSTSSTNSQNLVISTGNATGSTSNSGNITIDSGTATGTAGTVNIGTGNYAHNVNVGNNTSGTVTSIKSGTSLQLSTNSGNTSACLETGGFIINASCVANSVGLTVLPWQFNNKGLVVEASSRNGTQSADLIQLQDASGNPLSGFNATGNLYVGRASAATGSIKLFNTGGSGSITLTPANPSSTDYTITLPAETGTVCTTAASGVCNTAGGLSNVAYLNQDQTLTGKNTFSRNGSGSSDYSVGVTGTPAASSTSSLLRIGSAITGGNGSANGGTYLSIIEPSSGAGSAADFLNFQNGSTVELQLSSAGNLTIGGTYNGNTFDNSGHLTFGNAGAATIKSNGSNDITIDTGSSGGTETIGNNAATTNIATSNAAHTIGIGTGGGGTTTQAITIGAATNSSSTLTLQGGNGSSAILLQTGNNGSGVAGGIQIGNTSGANSQTISLGNNNSGSNIVNIGTGTSQDSVTIGDTTNANSSVSIKAGSTGGISLGANTTLSANSNFTVASGSGNFDAHNSTGTFQTSSGNNSLNGATTVTGTNTFTVSGGATTLNGAAAGSGTAAKVNTNAASNIGLVVQGASSQAAALLQLQDSNGAAVLNADASGDLDLLGYSNTPYGGIGAYGNLVLYSEQLDQSGNWTRSNLTSVTANDGASNPAPDGNTTADKIVTSGSGTHSLAQTYSSAGNNTYTFSIWLKTVTPPQTIQLRIDSNGTPATGTAASFSLTSNWQRYSVTQTFSSGVTTITPTLLISSNSISIVGWGAQLIQGNTAGVYARTGTSTVAAGSGIIDNQSAIFQALTNSTTAYQFQNTSGVNVAAVDTTNGQVVLGTSGGSGLTGQIKFNFSGQTGSISLAPLTPSSTNYTINLPAENGTICTTAASVACTAVYSSAGSFVNFAPSSVQADASNNNSVFINKTSGTGNIFELQKSGADVVKVDNTGNLTAAQQGTFSRNSSGSSDYTFGVTGTTSATGTSSLVRIGGALTGGNGAANGGTYLSIIEPSSGAGSAADFVNFQNGSTVELQLTSGGNLTVGGTYNGNTFDNAGHLTFGNAGAATIKSNGSNDITLDTGSSGGTETLGNNAATTNLGTSNAAHTIGIGTGGGGTTTQAITLGAATNSSSTLTLQGGNGSGAISLLTGNNGSGVAGTISIGNTSGANSQTISIGTNATASATNVVHIGDAATAQDTVTIGSTSNASSSVSINGGSTNGITLTANTTNINSGTVATNQSTIAVFNSPTNVTEYQAGTSISIGATTGTLTVRNANQTFGNAAGAGVFQNNGATYNSTLVVNDDSNGGTLGGTPSGGLTAAQSVDVYTAISINQTTGGQTITIPTPTGSANYGRVVYVTNIGTASFIISNVTINPGQGGTMVWSNTNGGASWQFAGAGADAINNQNAVDQTGNFRISGTGRANTSFTSPVFDSISGSLGIGSVNATTINIGNSGSTPTTNVNITTKGAGTTIKTATDVTNAFQVQTNAGANILQVDSQNRNIKVYENGGSTNYALIYFDTATATANYTASAGTVAVGRGAGAISVVAGSGSAITITANAASTWKTTAGTLTLQSGTGGSDFLILNAGGSNQVQVNGSAVVKLGSASADPTCTTGAIYYNSTTNLFRGCQNGTWATLSSTTQTLQQAYTASTGGSTAEVKLDTTRTGFDIQDADTTLGGVLFAVRGSNAGGLGTSLFNVSSSNSTVNVGTSANSTALLVLGIDTNSTFNAGTTTSGATEIDGAMFYSSSDNNFLCGVAGSWMTCNGLLYSNTAASSAVNTCTTACAAFSRAAPIPAGYCQVGRVIHIIAKGIYGLQNVASQTFALGVYYGTDNTTKTNDTLLGTSTATTALTNLTNNGWRLDTTIICYDTTHMQTEGDFTYSISNTAATAGQTVLQNDTGTAGTSVVSTSAKNIYLFPAYGASNAANTATLQQLIVTGN